MVTPFQGDNWFQADHSQVILAAGSIPASAFAAASRSELAALPVGASGLHSPGKSLGCFQSSR